MGYGLPAFIGALESKKSENNRFLIESDGSLMLNLQELQTLKTRNKNKFKILILNNNGYCSIRATQKIILVEIMSLQMQKVVWRFQI